MTSNLAPLILGLLSLAIGDEPPPGAGAEYAALAKEFAVAREAWQAFVPEPRPPVGDPYWIEHRRANPELSFAPRLVGFAEAHPDDPAAVDAALAVLRMNPGARDREVFPLYLRARDLLIRHHLEDQDVVRALLASPFLLVGHTEPYFHALLAKSTDGETLSRARMALVACNQVRLRVAARPFFDQPEVCPELVQESLAIRERLHPDYMAYFRAADQASLRREIEELLERVAAEAGDISYMPDWAPAKSKERWKGRRLADEANAQLFRLRNLQLGQAAPEVEGEDIDGRPMRLSDFRGKVVLVVFWGTWCGPCMASIPMEKALAERLKDRPFAIVGVNSDGDRGKVKEAVAQKGITWRSWFDGGRTGGPIADRWNVHAWPTMILIDQAGVIRGGGFAPNQPDELDKAVDALLDKPTS